MAAGEIAAALEPRCGSRRAGDEIRPLIRVVEELDLLECARGCAWIVDRFELRQDGVCEGDPEARDARARRRRLENRELNLGERRAGRDLGHEPGGRAQRDGGRRKESVQLLANERITKKVHDITGDVTTATGKARPCTC